MDQRTLLYFFLGLSALLLAKRFSSKGQKKYKLPPLVPGVPIFGNALQVPPTQQGQWAKDLAAKYGEMYELLDLPNEIALKLWVQVYGQVRSKHMGIFKLLTGSDRSHGEKSRYILVTSTISNDAGHYVWWW